MLGDRDTEREREIDCRVLIASCCPLDLEA